MRHVLRYHCFPSCFIFPLILGSIVQKILAGDLIRYLSCRRVLKALDTNAKHVRSKPSRRGQAFKCIQHLHCPTDLLWQGRFVLPRAFRPVRRIRCMQDVRRDVHRRRTRSVHASQCIVSIPHDSLQERISCNVEATNLLKLLLNRVQWLVFASESQVQYLDSVLKWQWAWN